MSFAEFSLWVSPQSSVSEGIEIFKILIDASQCNARGAPVKFMGGRFPPPLFFPPLHCVCVCLSVGLCVCVSVIYIYMCIRYLCKTVYKYIYTRYFCNIHTYIHTRTHTHTHQVLLQYSSKVASPDN